MMTGSGSVRGQLDTMVPPFISCLFLTLLKAHCTSHHATQCVGFGCLRYDNTPLPLDTHICCPMTIVFGNVRVFGLLPSICSLQPLGHIDGLSLLPIRTDEVMPLFPWAGPSCALTLQLSQYRVCITLLHVCTPSINSGRLAFSETILSQIV